MVIVPSNGFAGNIFAEGIEVDYLVLGPFASGVWVRRVDLLVTLSAGSGGTRVGVGVVLVGTDSPTVENYQSGTSLVQRAEVTVLRQPAILLDAVDGGAMRLVLWPGVRVSTGSRFMIVAAQNQTVGRNITVTASVATVAAVDQAEVERGLS